MRFRIRSMLILVAVVVVLLGAEKTRRRWVHYSRRAAFHAAQEARLTKDLRVADSELKWMERYRIKGPTCGNAAQVENAIRRLVPIWAEEAAHHAILKQEYRRRW
jgi:hypothetical protein